MIKSEFSEKFFEFFVNHLIMNRYNVHLYIPSQSKEALLGYDASLKFRRSKILLLQYKIVSQYERVPSYLGAPAFRFQLHKNKNTGYTQHNALVKANKKSYILAGYVVPSFIDYKSLYGSVNANTLLCKSIFIKPLLKIYDKRSHYMNFDTVNFYRHSKDMIKMNAIGMNDIMNDISQLDYFDKSYLIDKLYETLFDNEKYKPDNKAELVNDYLYKNQIALITLGDLL